MVNAFEYMIYIVVGGVAVVWAVAATIVHFFSKNK